MQRDFITKKLQLISSLKASGINNNKVLDAILKVPRHLFVIEGLKNLAYVNHALPIDCMQTISQPYIVALMTQEANIDSSSRVLEIGTGSGYQAAILAELCKEVFTIEIIRKLSETSSALLKKLEYKNVYTKCSDGHLGWPDQAPFDAIIVTAAAKEYPKELILQLKLNGKMLIPLEISQYNQILYKITKISEIGDVKLEKLIKVEFVYMTKTDKHTNSHF
jgi:protein-L-isoaspartate(D-aspartate) O-methyltransferase